MSATRRKPSWPCRIVMVCAALFAPLVIWALWSGWGKGDGAAATSETLVLIVMDTVRSDHTSLCGYQRPTTPNMAALAARDNTTYTCDGVAPASWTLPSHASFFTGVGPETHRTHCVKMKNVKLSGWGSNNRPLSKKLPTLAEEMKKKGYQTVIVSANPVITKSLGLLRGFELANISKTWGAYFGDGFEPAMRKTLADVSRDKPLFLFLNIADAHQPWRAIPQGMEWLQPRKGFGFSKGNTNGKWRRFVEGRMEEFQRAPFLEMATDLYDYGVYQADRNLGRALALLEKEGWCKGGCRFVVISDHGEFLGDHGLLDHGNYVYEEMVRVPLIAAGWNTPPEIPAVVNGAQVYHLIRDGALPSKPMPVTSAAWPHMRRCAHTEGKAFCSTSAALWNGAEKLLYKDGKYFAINLEDDPTGDAPNPIYPSHPRFEQIKQYAEKVVADTWDKPRKSGADQKLDKELEEKLKALGYWD